ncbi:tobamovirus multiplication protein 1-like isoform x1 [Anaeramoeba flamelloides]|uniref:Tobamovirus multiplication protein 1-like isoform x1 n=1 Tax=Anaeramoeba flamelloides TaxID=1746091 RepID=A0AAV7ZZS8_9EUKA|nr:tobamovirus multiplication protein 1-like isoform x1 [Anaeramoeba flamelloides]KAJ6237337.1 tobamovirus multiplication protein 1-like isoform x1 [Anaeramoeba flamelloides]
MHWELIFGIVLCCLIFVFAAIQFVKHIKSTYKGSRLTIQVKFHSIALLFLTFRIIWLIFKENGKYVTFEFTMNRFAILSFFASFTLLVFFWAEMAHGLLRSNTMIRLSTLRLPFYILNGLFLIYIIVCIIVVARSAPEDKEHDLFYDINVLVIAGISAIVSIGFFIYGILLIKRYRV